MSIFNWFKSKDTVDSDNITKREPRRPKETDWTDNLTINYELTNGLYHNTYPGMKLAGGLAFPPIAIPAWFMGLPVPQPINKDDEKLKEILESFIVKFEYEIMQINLQCHRDGTVWVWPKWSSKQNDIVLEFIPDDSITDIIRDVETGKIIQIITDENLKIRTGYNTVSFVRRTRYFTKTRIDIVWSAGKSSVPNELKDKSMRNPLGIMPIPFSNNKNINEVRGHSDYERIVSDLKDYHDIDLARSNMLAKFKTKMIQNVQDVDSWLTNNGYDEISDIDISQIDMIFNLAEQESTSFEFPERAYEAYESALKQKFKKIVEASGVPEIAWGLKTEGNHASVEESMSSLVMYVHDKQNQKTESYRQLSSDCLKIIQALNFQNNDDIIKVIWNDLDSLSEQTKAIIFEKFANGIAKLVGIAGMTKEQAHKLWLLMYPKATDEDFEKFKIGLSDMASHVQWTNASYTETLDFQKEPKKGEGEE